MSEVQHVLIMLYCMHINMHGVNFTALMIIVFKLIISVNYYFVFRNPPDRFKKVANCVNYKIKLEQGDFERILGFEHFLRDIENIAS